MIKLPASYGHALGQTKGSASSAHIDAAQQKELGWGSASFAMGFVTYGKVLRDEPSSFFVSDSALFIISVVSGADPLSEMLRRGKEERNFEVPLSKIVDIQVRKGDIDEVFELPGKEGSYQMTQQAVIRIRGKKDVLYVTTTDSTVFSKLLVGTWQELIACRAAGLGGKMRTNANKELAYEYYREITRSFSYKGATRVQRMALLQELGDEVRLDLEMKSLIFKNRELVVLILDDIGALLNEPSGLEREMRTKSSFNSGQLTQRKLATEIQNRLATIRCYLAFLADLFFCSDAVENRVYALSVSPPLDPTSWLEVLEPDLFVQLSRKLKFDVTLQGVALSTSVDDSGAEADGEQSPRRRTAGGDTTTAATTAAARRASSYGSRDDVQNLIRDVSQSGSGALTPREGDEGSYYALRVNSYNQNKTLDPVLLRTRRSVRDLQHVVTLEIYKAMSTGIPGTHTGFGRMHNRVTAARAHVPLGDCWVRQDEFDANLEHVLQRVNTLLEDILTSEKVKRGMSSSALGKNAKSRAQAAALVAAAVEGSGASRRPSIEELLAATTSEKEPSVRPSPGKKNRADRREERNNGPSSPRARSTSPRRADGGTGRNQNSTSSPLRPAKPATSPIRSPTPGASSTGKAKSSAPFGLHPVALETQEVLLYYTTSLLRALISDSGKIREVYGKELTSMWPSVFVTLDVICPRGAPPTDEDHSNYDDEENFDSGLATRTTSSFHRFFADCAHSQGLDTLLPFDLINSGGGGYSRGMTTQDRRASDFGQRLKSVGQGMGSLLSTMHDELTSKEKERVQLDPLPISCYGPSRVDISKECWELLVLSRINIEECMNALNLHGKRYGANNSAKLGSSKFASNGDAANGGMLGSSVKRLDRSANSPERSPRSSMTTRPFSTPSGGGGPTPTLDFAGAGIISNTASVGDDDIGGDNGIAAAAAAAPSGGAVGRRATRREERRNQAKASGRRDD